MRSYQICYLQQDWVGVLGSRFRMIRHDHVRKIQKPFWEKHVASSPNPQKWFYRRNVEYSQAFPLNQASMI